MDVNTGFANQTTHAMNYLSSKGHNCHYFAHNYIGQPLLPGVTLQDGLRFNFTIHGHGMQPYYKDLISPKLKELNADVFGVLLDTFMVYPWFATEIDFSPARTFFYFPSDGGGGLPQNCENILKRVDIPIAMSRFAQKQALEVHGLKTEYIPHACFGEKTFVLTNKGWTDIKEIVEKRKKVKVIGMSNKKLKWQKIQEYHKVKPKENTLKITFSDNCQLIVTKDHPVFDGEKYRAIASFKLNEKVYIPIDIYSEYEKGRDNLFSRVDRWRRDNINRKIYPPKQEKKEFHSEGEKDFQGVCISSIYSNKQFIQRINELAPTTEFPNFQTFSFQPNQEAMLCSQNEWNFNSQFNPENTSLFNNQERTSENYNSVLSKESKINSGKKLHKSRLRRLSTNSQFKSLKIIKIEEIVFNDFVYDITTPSHNFIANGILVHNCHPNDYFPLSEETRQKLKEEMIVHSITGVQIRGWLRDKFVFGTVARNQGRKMLDRTVKAFRRYIDKYKDEDAVLLFHIDPNDPAQVFDIRFLIAREKIQNRCCFTGMTFWKGFNYKDMNKVYNIMDVFLLSTSGEGFGIPIIEAASCGIPSVVTDYTTTQELLIEDGQCGEPARLQTEITGSWAVERGVVDIEDFADKMKKLYDDKKLREKYGRVGREKVEKIYNWNVVGEQWDNLIRRLAEK